MTDKGAHFYRCDLQVHTPRDRVAELAPQGINFLEGRLHRTAAGDSTLFLN
jgi:hypothetical protein